MTTATATPTTEKKRTPKRRGAGEGSIFQRGDGRWTATITVGYSTEGKRKRKTVYGATKREVTEELTRLQNDKLDGTLTARSRLTVAELIDRWLTNWSENLQPSSREKYRDMAERFIKPTLGGMDVAKVQPVHVRTLIDKMANDGRGERTRKYAFATLRRAMNLAVKLELAPRNPCDAVDAPRAKAKPVQPPNAEQVATLLSAVAGGPWETLVTLALATGLRQGELFALAWEDIDLKRRTLHVRHSVEDVKGITRLKEPKSRSGRRVVKLPQAAVDVLHAHRRNLMAEGKAGSPWLFSAPEGGFLQKATFYNRVWKPLRDAAGLSSLRFHDLRHAHASTLLRANVHPKIVQERLGHSNISLTLDTYSHLLPDAQDEAADAIDRAWKTANPADGCQLAVKAEQPEETAVALTA